MRLVPKAVSSGLFLALSFTLLLCLFPLKAFAAQSFLGVTWLGGSAHQIQDIAQTGAASVRRHFIWKSIEAHKGQYNFSEVDQEVLNAASYGVTLLPVVQDSPNWAAHKPSKEGHLYPPRKSSDYAIFLKVLVDRYGPQGAIWKDNPNIPYKPIRTWQIWNEPNLAYYWAPGAHPDQYLKLLKAAYQALHQTDPGSQVLAAGIPNARGSSGLLVYLQGMYRAGLSHYSDGIAIHPYANDSRGVEAGVKATRSLMNKYHDPHPLWITEFGWASAGHPHFVVSLNRQAQLLKQTANWMYKSRNRYHIPAIYWYNWRDTKSGRSAPWTSYCGLLTYRGDSKPAISTFRSLTQSFQ